VVGKTGLLRLKQDIPLTEAEVAAVDDGVATFDMLLTHLADVPTPAGPTPRHLEEHRASEPTQVRRGDGYHLGRFQTAEGGRRDRTGARALRVHLHRIGATELRGRCPLPATSSRSRDSFSVSIARNVWSCRSLSCMQARGGRPGGNILDLVALMEGCSIRDAALRLQDWSGAAPERFIVPRASRPDPAASDNPPLRFAVQYVDATHPFRPDTRSSASWARRCRGTKQISWQPTSIACC
jgi:hypothetical protein